MMTYQHPVCHILLRFSKKRFRQVWLNANMPLATIMFKACSGLYQRKLIDNFVVHECCWHSLHFTQYHCDMPYEASRFCKTQWCPRIKLCDKVINHNKIADCQGSAGRNVALRVKQKDN